MNDEQGTRGSKHETDNLSRSPTPPKHTTTPTNRVKKRKTEESVEELKQLQAKEVETQTAENAADPEEAAKRTTTAEDASNGTGAREGDGDPSPWPDASEAEWVKFFKELKDAETTAKAIATNRAAALEADQAEKDHCRHVKGLPCDNRRCNLVICLRQQQLRDYVMRHPTKPKPEAEEKEEALCYNCSKPGHQSYACTSARTITRMPRKDPHHPAGSPWPCERCNDGSSHNLSACPSYKGCENCSSKQHLQRRCRTGTHSETNGDPTKAQAAHGIRNHGEGCSSKESNDCDTSHTIGNGTDTVVGHNAANRETSEIAHAALQEPPKDRTITATTGMVSTKLTITADEQTVSTATEVHSDLTQLQATPTAQELTIEPSRPQRAKPESADPTAKPESADPTTN